MLHKSAHNSPGSPVRGTQKLPQPFTDRIREQFPEEYPEFLDALDAPPATSIRLNPHKWPRMAERPELDSDESTASGQSGGSGPSTKIDPSGATRKIAASSKTSQSGSSETADIIKKLIGTDAAPVPWAQNGWFLDKRPKFTLDPLFHAGCYYVQEAGSMILEHVLSLPELRDNGDMILDACAAPGGKSTLIAAMFPESLVVANEVIRSRIPALLENSTKWGTGNLVITQSDTARFEGLKEFFDLAVVDAPCSGEGLFRKDRDARKEWSPENAHHCALRQRVILMDTWNTIRPGGHLIYTTCTFNPEENEKNVSWLLDRTGGECIAVPGDSRFHEMITEIREDGVIGYGIYPHRSQGEGFFLSVIRKTVSGRESQSSRPFLRAAHLAEPDSAASKKTESWFAQDADFRLFQIRDRLYRIRIKHWVSLHILSSLLPVRYAGTEVAGIIREDVRPAPAAALDMHLNSENFPQIACTRDDALRFLRRESLSVPESADTGWHLATFFGFPLGWLKNIGRRMNNYHPKEWRIRQ